MKQLVLIQIVQNFSWDDCTKFTAGNKLSLNFKVRFVVKETRRQSAALELISSKIQGVKYCYTGT